MSFFEEIKRRKVFQVAVVYAVVAWLTIQIVDVVGEPLNLPDWFDTFVIVLFAVGFPIAVLLAWAFDITPEGVKSDSDKRANRVSQLPGQGLNLIIQGLVLLAVVFLVANQFLFEPATRGAENVSASASLRSSSGVRRFTIPLGESQPAGDSNLGSEIAVSRDGSQLAYVVNSEDGPGVVYLRSLDRLDATPISRGGRRPFFSEDGERLGMFGGAGQRSGAGGRQGSILRTFSLHGGPPQSYLDRRTTRKFGGSWHGDTVVFSESSIEEDSGGSLYQLSTTESSTKLLLAPEPGEAYVYPQFLPDGNAVLFTVREVDGSARDGAVAVLSLETGEHRQLIENGFDARYAATGHLVFARAGALWAVAFDPKTLEVSGVQTPVVDDVQMDGNFGDASYGFSDDGMLVYVEGDDVGDGAQSSSQESLRTLAILSTDGSVTSLPMRARAIERLAVPPNGSRLAAVINEAGNRDIYIYDDLTRITPRRLTFDSAEDDYPIWTPDGERVVFWSTRDGGGIFAKFADGTGQAQRLTTSSVLQRPSSFAPNGSEFFFVDGASADGELPNGTLYRMSLNGKNEPEPLLQTETPELDASLSSDGRWLAYGSGRWPKNEIYVEPYPNPMGSKWQVSTGGFAVAPSWIDDDNALVYFKWDSKQSMRVPIETEPTFVAGEPEQMLTGPLPTGLVYTVAARLGNDGQRLFFAREVTDQSESNETTLLVVENWFEELDALMAPSN